jgi:hypothetical protein
MLVTLHYLSMFAIGTYIVLYTLMYQKEYLLDESPSAAPVQYAALD